MFQRKIVIQNTQILLLYISLGEGGMAISRQRSLWVSDVLSNNGHNSCLKPDAPAQADWCSEEASASPRLKHPSKWGEMGLTKVSESKPKLSQICRASLVKKWSQVTMGDRQDRTSVWSPHTTSSWVLFKSPSCSSVHLPKDFLWRKRTSVPSEMREWKIKEK